MIVPPLNIAVYAIKVVASLVLHFISKKTEDAKIVQHIANFALIPRIVLSVSQIISYTMEHVCNHVMLPIFSLMRHK